MGILLVSEDVARNNVLRINARVIGGDQKRAKKNSATGFREYQQFSKTTTPRTPS
jgi:hypothetical protein